MQSGLEIKMNRMNFKLKIKKNVYKFLRRCQRSCTCYAEKVIKE